MKEKEQSTFLVPYGTTKAEAIATRPRLLNREAQRIIDWELKYADEAAADKKWHPPVANLMYQLLEQTITCPDDNLVSIDEILYSPTIWPRFKKKAGTPSKLDSCRKKIKDKLSPVVLAFNHLWQGLDGRGIIQIFDEDGKLVGVAYPTDPNDIQRVLDKYAQRAKLALESKQVMDTAMRLLTAGATSPALPASAPVAKKNDGDDDAAPLAVAASR